MIKNIQAVEYLISGAGGIDPDTEIDDDTYDECYDELSSVLQNAYTCRSYQKVSGAPMEVYITVRFARW
ncbi:PipA/GogA/GtgA family type III secretion system effector [Salmonella enterica]|nr:PipA/GogA/GtgA family type III secretion system effector [Salmonella enterica]ECP5407722.1 PipA/GogA/GtgA family type III secretion system effector [Salmonella enterica]ELD7830626.1 PipA/GogA/GtgA family type III secretion system effector [Salmonella enterica]ELR7915613.1 PipA/GogA/GtgA family type III secretion system effector [Salmonella enterica]